MGDVLLLVVVMVLALILCVAERRRQRYWMDYLRRAPSEAELAARERVACVEAVASQAGGLQLRAVAILCGQLVDQGCRVTRLADRQRPWSELEPELVRAHHLLEELGQAHSDLERRIEQRYADEIAAGEARP